MTSQTPFTGATTYFDDYYYGNILCSNSKNSNNKMITMKVFVQCVQKSCTIEIIISAHTHKHTDIRTHEHIQNLIFIRKLKL